jgi:hypothetical protein
LTCGTKYANDLAINAAAWLSPGSVEGEQAHAEGYAASESAQTVTGAKPFSLIRQTINQYQNPIIQLFTEGYKSDAILSKFEISQS